ncbi:MAG: VC_2705 family sodium/solute symporter [Leptospiraceae bacterium]|nr:VC_2705 family sodium/solute symporter [Leptospiraceae bacterium]MDW7975079.1 VC_2705 family sodium/solute symporter [Leptospiraceae bacterium]
MTVKDPFYEKLKKVYGIFTLGFLGFIIVLGIAEYFGLKKEYIGYTYLFGTILLYAVIGVISRTKKVTEYYVAGRRVPGIFNGMATASDWMSAASFIGMAGTVYAMGYDGLAFIMGWTGGYVLLAVMIAPYLRKFGAYTIPDFLDSRYGGKIPRLIGIISALIVSFTYLVAQVTGVGIITSRFLGFPFEIGVFLGLVGILVCSFLGGMRAVTWTQVAQYIILIIAYLIPAIFMSYKQTGIPIPQLTYGQALQNIEQARAKYREDETEKQVREILKQRAADLEAKIKALPTSWEEGKKELEAKLAAATDEQEKAKIQEQLNKYPKSPEEAKTKWEEAMKDARARSAPPKSYVSPPAKTVDYANFIILTFVLMVGTAGLPHILMRFYTTPTVREARSSAGWALFFIFLLYFTAPAYAAFYGSELVLSIVGQAVNALPGWVQSWGKVGLITIADVNGDGIVQFAEIRVHPDAIVLATPEIAGLPYVIAGLVAAGGLAAALSTADGLLITMSNAIAHDLYYKIINPNVSPDTRVKIGKSLLLVIAVIGAYVASFRLAIIVELVAWAFSLAASTFFPQVLLGVWDRRNNKQGAIAGMIVGLLVCGFYLIGSRFYGLDWFGIRTINSGIFGMIANFVVSIVVSRLTPPPPQEIQDFIYHIRHPKGEIAYKDVEN